MKKFFKNLFKSKKTKEVEEIVAFGVSHGISRDYAEIVARCYVYKEDMDISC